MDISSGSGYPSSALSNFSPHFFTIDGVLCNSMEGFLQSLKFKNAAIQAEVCKLVGKAAKFRGKNKKWFKTQMLWWRGQPYPRDSMIYQELLDRAYLTMCEQNESFRRALLATGDAVLTHSMGRTKENETILTQREFCSRLTNLRNLLQKDLYANEKNKSNKKSKIGR